MASIWKAWNRYGKQLGYQTSLPWPLNYMCVLLPAFACLCLLTVLRDLHSSVLLSWFLVSGLSFKMNTHQLVCTLILALYRMNTRDSLGIHIGHVHFMCPHFTCVSIMQVCAWANDLSDLVFPDVISKNWSLLCIY